MISIQIPKTINIYKIKLSVQSLVPVPGAWSLVSVAPSLLFLVLSPQSKSPCPQSLVPAVPSPQFLILSPWSLFPSPQPLASKPYPLAPNLQSLVPNSQFLLPIPQSLIPISYSLVASSQSLYSLIPSPLSLVLSQAFYLFMRVKFQVVFNNYSELVFKQRCGDSNVCRTKVGEKRLLICDVLGPCVGLFFNM